MKFIFQETNEQNKQRIFYDEKDLSFSCENLNDCNFTIMTGCAYIGIDINLYNGQVLQVSGCCPRIVWKEKKLKMPDNIKNGKIFVKIDEKWKDGTGVYLSNKKIPIYFDKVKKCICIGNYKSSMQDFNIRIASNLIISLSKNKELKTIFIYPLEIK